MSRVKRGVIALKRRRKILRQTKGFMWGRKSKERAAKEALLHAYTHAFRDRKNKKREFRRTWQVRINAAVRQEGLNYSSFLSKLKKANIILNRKMLAALAEKEPSAFSELVEKVKIQ